VKSEDVTVGLRVIWEKDPSRVFRVSESPREGGLIYLEHRHMFAYAHELEPATGEQRLALFSYALRDLMQLHDVRLELSEERDGRTRVVYADGFDEESFRGPA
jgi:hypothetical protein